MRRTPRHRRPTGAPPPLPHPVSVTTRAWLVLAVVVLAGVIVISVRAPSLRLDDQVNSAVLRFFARARTPWLTDVASGISAAGSGWGATVLGLSAVVLTIAFRRWRHLLVFLCSLFLLEVAIQLIAEGMTRPRPYGVLIIGGWAGYSAPAVSVTVLTFLLVSIAYCLVVPGRPRSYAKAAIAVIVTVFCLARLYLAVDHVDDLLLGVALGVAIPVSAFRFFTPNEVFPVAYRRGNTAHVDVTGARGEAIRQGVRDQLGLTVTGITPVGLESSAGSTPLRLRTEGGPQEYLFAKLYTKGHVRADRWYKIWRTILYGSLEDEHPFQTVRRLAEYEDYALRLLQDAGIAVARPYGIVEITPEREYLLVTEFFDGAVEIGDADIDDQVIDQGLLLIRALWDAGIAHRDIKPGNLMVRAGQLLLIDVAFAQVRPSPWRQAVDLGNMMLVLAVRTDPARVYRQALNYFTEAELAEAFAATRGVASPTQLRAFMKRDPRDLLAEFRKLAPQRQPIVLQRWSIRRVTLAAAMLALFAVPTVFGVGLLLPANNSGVHAPVVHAPECGTGHTMILAAQAVPSAAFLPCIAALPSGWTAADARDLQRAGQLRAELRLRPGASGLNLSSAVAGRAGDGDDHPDRDLQHHGRPADPLRPARHAPVRAPARAWSRGTPTSATTPSPAAARPISSSLRPAPPRPWLPRSTPRWRSCPGRSWSATSAAPRAWPCAGEVPHARDDPAGHGPAAGGRASRPSPAGRAPHRRGGGGHGRGVRPGRRPRHAGPHPAA